MSNLQRPNPDERLEVPDDLLRVQVFGAAHRDVEQEGDGVLLLPHFSDERQQEIPSVLVEFFEDVGVHPTSIEHAFDVGNSWLLGICLLESV